MAMLDHQGRLFGRVNLIDAAVALFVIALVPLGYVSWALFRTPPPVIETVIPKTIAPGQDKQHIELRGRHLRPYLRADVGSTPVLFLFESADRAQLQLPALAPGTYDLVFFDSREIARFPNAVTVSPGKVVEIQVRFVTRPEILQEVKRSLQESAEAGSAPNTSRPGLVSYELISELVGTTKPDLQEGPISVIRALVRVNASWTSDGWRADNVALKAGADFTLTAPTYVLHGDILSVGEVPSAVR